MQGVKIINTIHEYKTLIPDSWYVGFTALGVIACIIGLLAGWHDTIYTIMTFLATIALVGMAVCIIGSCIKTDEIISTKYQVTISDEVSMDEFYKHYEVIERDGKIFTVREKDKNV